MPRRNKPADVFLNLADNLRRQCDYLFEAELGKILANLITVLKRSRNHQDSGLAKMRQHFKRYDGQGYGKFLIGIVPLNRSRDDASKFIDKLIILEEIQRQSAFVADGQKEKLVSLIDDLDKIQDFRLEHNRSFPYYLLPFLTGVTMT